MLYPGNLIIEICTDQLSTALAAASLGANRIELCASLSEGGCTPPSSLIQAVCHQATIPVHVMIRPRSGDFLYDADEFRMMEQDVAHAKKAGAAGVVFGILNDDGTVDRTRCAELIHLAAPLSTTFHRAFDMTSDPFMSLEEIITLGMDALLTSGHRQTAEDGLELIRELVKRANGRITVMAGSGINAENAPLLFEAGVRAFHFTAHRAVSGGMKYRNESLFSMGNQVVPGEYERIAPDEEKIHNILQSLKLP